MWLIHGQDHILTQIKASLSANRLAHAYLFCGPSGVGKMCFAMDLAKAVNCVSDMEQPCGLCEQCVRIASKNHSDVRVLGVQNSDNDSRSRTVIGIDDVKEVLHKTNLKPFEGKCTVIVFDGAENLSTEASNALLKTLEEPSPQVLIILLTNNDANILDTIRSRCRSYTFNVLPKELITKILIDEYSCNSENSELIARLSRGSIGWAISAATNPDALKQRDADLNHLQQTMEAGLVEKFDYVSELASEFGRNRDGVKDVLYLWRTWCRDLIILNMSSEEHVINSDKITMLKDQESNMNFRDISSFVRVVDRTIYALDHNVNPRLALENMILNMPKVR